MTFTEFYRTKHPDHNFTDSLLGALGALNGFVEGDHKNIVVTMPPRFGKTSIADALIDYMASLSNGAMLANDIEDVPEVGHAIEFLILDDPWLIKSDEASRRAAWTDFMNVLEKLPPNSRVAILCSRYHFADPVGLLSRWDGADGWMILNVPLIVGEDVADPKRYPKASVLGMRNEIGEYKFQTMFIGKPPSDGPDEKAEREARRKNAERQRRASERANLDRAFKAGVMRGMALASGVDNNGAPVEGGETMPEMEINLIPPWDAKSKVKPCDCRCGYTCGGPGVCELEMSECIEKHFKNDCDHDFSGPMIGGETEGGGYFMTSTCLHCGATSADHDCKVGP